MRFLHCSDVHVTQNYLRSPLLKLGWRRWVALWELSVGGRAARYVAAPQTLKTIQADAERHRVDHLIVSGDLTAYATQAEFEGARAALEPACLDRSRCTIIPGNHDVYTPGAHGSQRFQRYFGHLLESDLPEHCREGQFPFVRKVGEEVALVGLNSARVPPVPGFSYGIIGKAQLGALRDITHDERLSGRAILVVVHHAPLGRLGRPDRLLHGLVDAKKLFALTAGPRFAVLHGHIHQRYHHPATSERPHLFGAGSSTELGHEGYWLIDVKDGRIDGVIGRPGGALAHEEKDKDRVPAHAH